MNYQTLTAGKSNAKSAAFAREDPHMQNAALENPVPEYRAD